MVEFYASQEGRAFYFLTGTLEIKAHGHGLSAAGKGARVTAHWAKGCGAERVRSGSHELCLSSY